MKTTSGWSAKLTRSIVLKDGTRLVTLGDVRAFILKQPEHIQERGSWQHAAELMILAAERGGSIEAATTQIEDAPTHEPRYARGCCEQHVNGCGRVILKTKNDDWLGCLCMSNTAERAHEQGGRALCLKRKPKKSASRKM